MTHPWYSWVFIQKKWEHMVIQRLARQYFSSFIYKSQKRGVGRVPIYWQMDTRGTYTKNELLISKITWMDLKVIMWSKRWQKKNTQCMILITENSGNANIYCDTSVVSRKTRTQRWSGSPRGTENPVEEDRVHLGGGDGFPGGHSVCTVNTWGSLCASCMYVTVTQNQTGIHTSHPVLCTALFTKVVFYGQLHSMQQSLFNGIIS